MAFPGFHSCLMRHEAAHAGQMQGIMLSLSNAEVKPSPGVDPA